MELVRMNDLSTEASLRRYLEDIRKNQVMSKDEERILFEKYRIGSRAARDKLIRGNMRFVVKVALHFHNVPIPMPDLISEGALGLIKAIESYDSSRGIKFISYAVWWIRSYIMRSVQQSGALIRIPSNQLLRISKENRSFTKSRMANDEVRQIMEISRPDRNGEEGWNKIRNGQSLTESTEQEKELSAYNLTWTLQSAISELPTREAYVVRNLYGLNQEEANTLEQVASEIGVSSERTRQLKLKALERLKMHGGCRAMAGINHL